MRELHKHERDSERQSIESIVKKKQQKELKIENSIKPYKGHKLFEINTKTLEIKEALFLQEEVIDFEKHMNGAISIVKNKKVSMKKNSVYISALNVNCALKRYKKQKGSAVIKSVNESL